MAPSCDDYRSFIQPHLMPDVWLIVKPEEDLAHSSGLYSSDVSEGSGSDRLVQAPGDTRQLTDTSGISCRNTHPPTLPHAHTHIHTHIQPHVQA